jgi:broad specificity phosphatase PhoE
MQILLIRHGPSAHPIGNGWVDAAGFQRWRDGYDAAGIDPLAEPPASLIASVAGAQVVAASDLKRALESAARLAPARPIIRSALLREAPLPAPGWIPLRLPIAAWDALTHAQWGYHILRRRDATPDDVERAAAAVRWLLSLPDAPASVAVITHGVFRRLVAARLSELGWQAQAGRSYKCWSVWSFSSAASFVDQERT